MVYFLATFKAIASLFVVGLIGFFITRRKIIPEKLLEALSTLALDFALPCLVFYKTISNFNTTTINWYKLPFYWVLFAMGAFLLAKISSLVIRSKFKEEFQLTATFQNAVFIPLITITSIWEDNSTLLIYIFLFTLFYPAFFFNFYFIFFPKAKRNKLNWKKALNPIFLATIVAVTIKIIHLDGYIPSFIMLSLAMISNMAIPLIMIVVGGIIYVDLKASGTIYWSEIFKFISIKNILFPATTILILSILKLEPNLAFLLLMQAAVPPLTATPLFAGRAGGNRAVSNQYLVASFLFALISYPLAIYCYQHFVGAIN